MENTLNLQQLFNDRIFQVPDFQRGYAWEKSHVEEFLDDLELLSSTRHHYTGTVILLNRSDAVKKSDNEGKSHTETDIVDGQQRLTTIVILLNEISAALSKHENSRGLAQGIKKITSKALA